MTITSIDSSFTSCGIRFDVVDRYLLFPDRASNLRFIVIKQGDYRKV